MDLCDSEYYGSPAKASEALIEGMKKYFPDIDYDYSCQELDGDTIHDDTISVVGGVMTQQNYEYSGDEMEDYYRF